MAKNRISKYLLYAIGEVILVVIGILIALQINTWNKEKQNLALERTALENLKEDLVIQKEIAQIQVDNENLKLEQADSCMLFLDSELGIEDFRRLLVNLASRRTFVANRATFDNMTSTGGSVIVKDPTLQNHIIRYYQRLEYVTTVINNNNLFLIDDRFGDFVYNNDLGLVMGENGSLDHDFVVTPEKKFTIHSQLSGRIQCSESLQRISAEIMAETDSLIADIDRVLGE
jgi:hypothetical protein